MMQKIIITGHRGIVGQILVKGLTNNYRIVGVGLPELNIAHDYAQLKEITAGANCIVHLAWDTEVGFTNELYNPDDLTMACNIYRVAIENGIERVIIASSVHADRYSDWDGPGLKRVTDIPNPDSPYGAAKVYVEALGKFYAGKGLEVVCIRLGGVTPEDSKQIDELLFDKVYLSHRDCTDLFAKVIAAETVPSYTLMYAVSDNKTRIHDVSNPFQWVPQDSST
jgi:nucleoside-diphosphate-sugar epimerase